MAHLLSTWGTLVLGTLNRKALNNYYSDPDLTDLKASQDCDKREFMTLLVEIEV
jgi:hypothetical protein